MDKGLTIDKCDGLIGIFWTRLGTPTKTAESGTEHEIRLAIGSWKDREKPTKPIMLYFCNKSIDPNKVDGIQLAALKAFREEISEQALWCAYTEVEDFERLLRKNLTNYLREYPLKTISDFSARSAQLQVELEEMKSLAATVIRTEWETQPQPLSRYQRKLALACYQELRDLVKKSLAAPSSPAGQAKALQLVLRCPVEAEEDLALALQNHAAWPADLPEVDEADEDRLLRLAGRTECRLGASRWLFQKGTISIAELGTNTMISGAQELEALLKSIPEQHPRRPELEDELAGLAAQEIIGQLQA